MIQSRGVFPSLYTDRGNHYWHTPEAGGKVDKTNPTQFGRALRQLGYLADEYLPAFNEEFSSLSPGRKSVFVPWCGCDLEEILCEQHERVVNNDNCISFQSLILQIPEDDYRYHYVKTKVRVLRHIDGKLSLFHGPRKLASYDAGGMLLMEAQKKVA